VCGKHHALLEVGKPGTPRTFFNVCDDCQRRGWDVNFDMWHNLAQWKLRFWAAVAVVVTLAVLLLWP
jgi:hypothetical protein